MIRRDAIASVVKLASVVLLGFAVSACKYLSSEPGIRQARALSAEELTAIFRGMEELQRKLPPDGWQFEGDDARLPERIRALDATSIDVGYLDRIVLSGGFDDKAALVFDGLSRRPGAEADSAVSGGSARRSALGRGCARACRAVIGGTAGVNHNRSTDGSRTRR